jgi:hypothetical protein
MDGSKATTRSTEPYFGKKAIMTLTYRPPACPPSLVVNEHFEGDGAIVFREACRLGCEGIVSKRLGSPYRSGRPISSAIVVGDRRTTANGGLGRQLGTIARDKGRQAARFVGSNRKGIRWT